ncbi:hypothetical protein E4U13_005124, partial [Claviceps humidiphila]
MFVAGMERCPEHEGCQDNGARVAEYENTPQGFENTPQGFENTPQRLTRFGRG